MRRITIITAAVAALGAAQESARAAQYRIYYQGSEQMAIQSSVQPRPAGYLGTAAAPIDPNNLGAPSPARAPAANHGAGTPNQIVTFLHPYTNKAITVPLTLPAGRPTLVTRSDRIIYDYGLFSYKVVVKFLPNGLVEVRYRG